MQTSHCAEQEVYFLIIREAGGDITNASIQDLWVEDTHGTGEEGRGRRMIVWSPLYLHVGAWHACGNSEQVSPALVPAREPRQLQTLEEPVPDRLTSCPLWAGVPKQYRVLESSCSLSY